MNKGSETGMYVEFIFSEGDREFPFLYELSFEEATEGIRRLFSYKGVEIDGTDKDIWNICAELDIIDTIENDDLFIELVSELSKDRAYEEFLDYMEYDEL